MYCSSACEVASRQRNRSLLYRACCQSSNSARVGGWKAPAPHLLRPVLLHLLYSNFRLSSTPLCHHVECADMVCSHESSGSSLQKEMAAERRHRGLLKQLQYIIFSPFLFAIIATLLATFFNASVRISDRAALKQQASCSNWFCCIHSSYACAELFDLLLLVVSV